MTGGTAAACRSSHARRPAPAKLVRLQHGDPAARLPDEAEIDEAVESAIHVLAAGADHARERSLAEWNVDRDTTTDGDALALGEFEQLSADTAGNVEESGLRDCGIFTTYVDREPRDHL